MFAQLGTALHLYDAFVPDKRLCFGKLFGQLRIEVGAVGNHDNGRAGKGRTAHQHTGQEEHRVTLAASRGAEIGAALAIAVSVQAAMAQDIIEQLMRSEELRIAAYYLRLFLGSIGEEHKVLDDAEQALFAEQPLHHRMQRIHAVGRLVLRADFAPCVEELIGREERAVLVVHAIADDHKRIVFEQFGNIAAIADSQLGEGIHDGGVLFDGALKLQYHHRQAVDIYDTVGDTFLLSFDFQLIDNAEDIVLRLLEVNRFNEEVGLGSIFPLDSEPLRDEPIGMRIVLVQRTTHIRRQAGEDALHLKRCHSVCGIATAQERPQVIAEQDIA